MEPNPYEAPKVVNAPAQASLSVIEWLTLAVEAVTVAVSCAVGGYLLGPDPESAFWAGIFGGVLYAVARVGWVALRLVRRS
jgi:hypothetical protein